MTNYSEQIEECPQGHGAYAMKAGRISGVDKYVVACRVWCWKGPECSTPEEAIKKWNEVMGCYRLDTIRSECDHNLVREANPHFLYSPKRVRGIRCHK